MRVYRVNGVEYKVYDSDDPLPERLIVQSNWRDGKVGDWVRSDDDCVIQVLRRGKMAKPKGRNKVREYIGTVQELSLLVIQSRWIPLAE